MQIALCRSTSLGSLLIRLVTWSDWSHVAIVDGDEVIEAVWPRVRVSNLSDLIAHHDACIVIEFATGRDTEIIAQRAHKSASRMIFSGYSACGGTATGSPKIRGGAPSSPRGHAIRPASLYSAPKPSTA